MKLNKTEQKIWKALQDGKTVFAVNTKYNWPYILYPSGKIEVWGPTSGTWRESIFSGGSLFNTSIRIKDAQLEFMSSWRD